MVPSCCSQILTSVLTHFLITDCDALNFPCWDVTTNHRGITTNHWDITTRSKVTTGYNYQPGSHTPVKPFKPPTHRDTMNIIVTREVKTYQWIIYHLHIYSHNLQMYSIPYSHFVMTYIE